VNGRNVETTAITVEPRRSSPDRRDLSERILDAARQLVVQQGARRLLLSEVATLAGVSRPTVYRYFVSKEELIDALGKLEYRRFNAAMDDAVSAASGRERLAAAIDVVAAFLADQPPRSLIDLEPGFVNEQMAQVLPMVTDALVVVLTRCADEDGPVPSAAPGDVAGAIARTALSHYIFPDEDDSAARRQIRAAAGLPAR
jgi:AcrR family transcriptional regulator